MFTIFRRELPPPPPPPKPFYRKNPIATWAVVLTMIGMFVLGPIGVIYKSMAEQLKAKANNETLLLYMKQQEERDAMQWKMIERKSIVQPEATINQRVPANIEDANKPALTPKQFEDYMNMSPERRKVFRSLHPSYATLPE